MHNLSKNSKSEKVKLRKNVLNPQFQFLFNEIIEARNIKLDTEIRMILII